MQPTLNIYIVDDDIDDIDFFSQAMMSINESIQCYSALNGEVGLHKLYNKDVPTPHCIFLDMNMPRVNGREFLVRIKEHEEMKNIPVIMYSTSQQEKEKEEYLQLGAAEFLVKPTKLADLQFMLKTVLSRLI